jgi:23S rRNA pseudouridine2605 synthase
MRINKYLAACGVASRRRADDIILAGRVKVNGETIEKPGVDVDETRDVVSVDDSVVKPAEQRVYILMNKPRDCLTTMTDPRQRRTVADFLRKASHRVYPVGRLDRNTTGVLLCTNDGELAHRLTHPRYEVSRVYRAIVEGLVVQSEVETLAHGIKLPDGLTGKAAGEIISADKNESELHLTLTEGRYHEVRQLCEAIGHPVKKLSRLSYAGLTAEKLRHGRWRYLTDDEISGLQRLVGLA